MIGPSSRGVPLPFSRNVLRLATVIRLRWFAVIGQFTVAMFVYYGLGLEFPILPVIAAILAGVAINVYSVATHQPRQPLMGSDLTVQLVLDVLQIGAVLAFTGGILNPFSLWLILPAMLAAFALRPSRSAIVLGVIGIVLTCITLWHAPLPWLDPGELTAPAIYSYGNWAAMMLGCGFTAWYARQVALTQSQLTTALETTQQVLAREERVTAVGALAAIAAHELGTPLATIQVTAKEMVGELGDGPLKEDAALVVSQAQRCQQILTRLASTGDDGEMPQETLTLDGLLKEAAKPFLQQAEPRLNFVFDTASEEAPPDAIPRQPAVIYGLRTLIENAIKFARTEVRITAKWNPERLSILIEDDGEGFTTEVLPRLGEPFARGDHSRGLDRRNGLGLGFFISRTLIERSGGNIEVGNARTLRGAWVELSWGLEALGASPTSPHKTPKEVTTA